MVRSKPADQRTVRTRGSIRKAATLLFARHGFHGAAARDIARDAGVPLSGLHYHFGSKHGLFVDVFAEHFQNLANERLAMLQRLRASSARLSVPMIVKAFVAPVFTLAQLPDGAAYLRMQVQVLDEPTLAMQLFQQYVLPATMPFVQALKEVLPSVKDTDLYRGYRNMVWAVSFTPIDPLYEMLAKEPACPKNDGAIKRLIEQLVRYHSAGLLALGDGPRTRSRPGK
jgi:AcrR family transcriptional regulator